MLRVWDVENDYALKQTLDSVPQDDMNFVEWHKQAPLLLTGGKDYMVWMVNAVSNKVMGSFMGHENEVTRAQFSKVDGGKHIVSVSVDSTIRTWSPLKSECVMTIRTSAGNKFHHEAILCMALHHDRPMIISGDSEGKVIASQYITGEVQGIIGKHDDSVEAIAICRV